MTTPEVYGSTDGGWIKEHNHFAPSTPYAVSRAACDLHLHSFHQAYGFPVVFTRAANVYGPGQQLYRIIPRALLSARTGESMQLHGGGHSVRAFIHIKDVVRATGVLLLLLLLLLLLTSLVAACMQVFRYPTDLRKPVLQGISFTVDRNSLETIAAARSHKAASSSALAMSL